jgi:putative transcriptional regulator
MAKKRDDSITVTEENFGDLLLEGLREVLAISRGEAEPARRVRRITARGATVQPPPTYPATAISRIRERMGLSQALFAQVLNASPETVKAWEQGKRTPDGMALALLEVAERSPEVLMSRIKKNGSAGTAKIG